MKQLQANDEVWQIPDKAVSQLLDQLGGMSVEGGVFRFHSYGSAKQWTKLVTEAYPSYRNKIISFGFDWQGQQYAKGINKDVISLFDIATGEDYQLTQTLDGFFNEDLVEYAEETLSIQDFKVWSQGKANLEFGQVVGFAQPLWLGGNDEPKNYQLIDGEVEWEINRQLKQTIKG